MYEYQSNHQRPNTGTSIDSLTVRSYAKQILMCVNEMHNLCLVHCDIRPEHFLFYCGRIRLIDFGSTNRTHDDVRTVQGTKIWMAPWIRSEPVTLSKPSSKKKKKKRVRVDYELDMWSVGMVLFFVFTGCTPPLDWDKSDWKEYLSSPSLHKEYVVLYLTFSNFVNKFKITSTGTKCAMRRCDF